jgi:hypothetical protein
MAGLEALLWLLRGAPVVVLRRNGRHVSAATGLESVRKSHLDLVSIVGTCSDSHTFAPPTIFVKVRYR